MPTVTQIFLLLCLRATAAVSTDGGGVPALLLDFFGFGPVYEQSRFTPLSFHAAEKSVHHNGSIERAQGPCYGMSSCGSPFYLSIYLSHILLILLKFKTKVTLVTAQYAVTMAAVLAPVRSVVETVSVMRGMDAVKI
jgi:hypothetical protein